MDEGVTVTGGLLGVVGVRVMSLSLSMTGHRERNIGRGAPNIVGE